MKNLYNDNYKTLYNIIYIIVYIYATTEKKTILKFMRNIKGFPSSKNNFEKEQS